jgi:hypothetical protein
MEEMDMVKGHRAAGGDAGMERRYDAAVCGR